MASSTAWCRLPKTVLPPAERRALETVVHIPGIGAVIIVAALFATGVFVTNMFGQWWLRPWDRLLSLFPIVKGIYSSVKQVSDTLFSSSGKRVPGAAGAVPAPKRQLDHHAFVTSKPAGEVAQHLCPDTHVSLYIAHGAQPLRFLPLMARWRTCVLST